jgi:hypothetical protein
MTKKDFLEELEFNFCEDVKMTILYAYDLTGEEEHKICEMDESEAEDYLKNYPKAEPLSKEGWCHSMLDNGYTDDSISLWNEYCDESFDSENKIYENNEEYFNEHYYDSPMDAVRAVIFGNYKLNDDYLHIRNGNIETFNYISDKKCPLDRNKLVEWLLE